MNRIPIIMVFCGFLTVLALVALAPRAYAELHKVYVANNGVDSDVCGSQGAPCRSITKAIVNAAPGDTIMVGPGKYGDLNDNGVLGETGEEAPPPRGPDDCGCMLFVNKTVTLLSEEGSAATLIDARGVLLNGGVFLRANVRVAADDVKFGVSGQGFTVTNGVAVISSGIDFFENSEGIWVSSARASIAGNRVIHTETSADLSSGHGIAVVTSTREISPASVLIEGNQVIGWQTGIVGGGNTTSNSNAIESNDQGILAFGGVVTGNVVTGNGDGIATDGNGNIIGNIIVGNERSGIYTTSSLGHVQYNNIFGNGCGIYTSAADQLADNNYWGAATGPGADPADDVCGTGTAIVTPYAVKPFSIKLKL